MDRRFEDQVQKDKQTGVRHEFQENREREERHLRNEEERRGAV